jgi:putative mRNA 3-end processing factor
VKEYNVSLDKNNEILLKNDKIDIYLDPKNIIDEHFVFISHAHTDHLLNKKYLKKFNLKNKIISSRETSTFANIRGYDVSNNFETYENIQLVDNGHILGSKGLLFDNKVFYTGDLSIRKRAFLNKPKIPKVETLIIESTFGRPMFKFPPIEKIVYEVNTLISEMYSRGIPVILMGYSLGKAQILTALFGLWKPLILHDNVYQFNNLHKEFGIVLEEAIPLSIAKEKSLLNKKPWVLIYPLTSGKNTYINYLKEKYSAVTVGFSGWAVNKNYGHMMNLDYVFPISDHCDFDELLEVIEKSSPEKIYTMHGFHVEFSKSLNHLGYNAEPISKLKIKKTKDLIKKNNTLDSFF